MVARVWRKQLSLCVVVLMVSERERERAGSIFAHSYHWGAVVLCKDRKIRLIRKQMLKANTRIYDMEIKRNATATAKDENYHRV